MPDVPPQDPDAENEALRLDRSTPDHVVRAANQRILLRWIIVAAAAIVILAYGYLEWLLLDYLFECRTEASDLFIILAVSPVVGVTVIVVFVLIGVFRGYRESDTQYLPTEIVGKTVFGGES